MPELHIKKGRKVYTVLVSEVDYERVSQIKWHIKVCDHTPYAYGTVIRNGKRQKISMHRFVMGTTDPSIFVDHWDGNGLNNTRENLREATVQQNNANRRVDCTNTTSQYKGVYLHKGRNRWRAVFKYEGKTYTAGFHACEHQAALAYNAKALEVAGPWAHLNTVRIEAA